jgi:hypothetical protein
VFFVQEKPFQILLLSAAKLDVVVRAGESIGNQS